MIWEQTITLARPLHSVRLDGGGSVDQASAVPEQLPGSTSAATAAAPVVGGRLNAAAADQSTTNQLLAQLGDLLRERRASSEQAFRDVKVAAIEIAVAVADRLYLSRVARGDQDLERLVNDALELLEPVGPVTVHLHPEDAGRLKTAVAAISGNDLQLVADSLVPAGIAKSGTANLRSDLIGRHN